MLFGSEGEYTILGVPVRFTISAKGSMFENHAQDNLLEGAGVITKLAKMCISSNVFRLISQGYSHVFVHEMSHALAWKLLNKSNESVKIRIVTELCTGQFSPPAISVENRSDWKNTIVNATGSMGNIAFSFCKLIAANRLKKYLSWPVALALSSGAATWILGELVYSFTSAVNEDGGDFGKIAKRNKKHLALASAAIIGECALGIFAVTRCFHLNTKKI